MQLIHEPNFTYDSFLGRNGICDLKVYKHNNKTVCLVSEINANTGPSVTNSAEFIYDKLSEKYDNMVMVEYYSDGYRSEPSYDIVTVANGQPHWQRITQDEWKELCGA